MSYSPNLVYFLDRLSGFSTNHFKLMPQGSPDGIKAGSISRFTLPANALLNTRSFKVHFSALTGGTTARLPADISQLVERVEVSAGGVQLSQGTNFYNTLVMAKNAVLGDDRVDTVAAHPLIVRNNNFDNNALAADAAETSGHHGACFCIDKWEGFLGTCEPKILDAAILPDLVVSIYWAPNNVLSASIGADSIFDFVDTTSAPANATYTVDKLHATIETIGLADSVYDNMVSSMIASKGYVEIPFKQYFSFSNTHSGSSRFTVATQSLDRIWMAWRRAGYDAQGPPKVVDGHHAQATATASVTVPYNGALNTNSEKYIGKFHEFGAPKSSTYGQPSAGAVDVTYQLQLNGAYIPQYPAEFTQMYELTKNSVVGAVRKNLSCQQYRDHYFVQCVRLNMPDSEFSRTLSGLDTRSVSLNGYVNTQNTLTNDNNLMIFAECTSSLRCGAGRQLEVVI